MGKRVLVVDDHSPTRILIRTILESDRLEAYQVFEAASGQGCLDAVGQHGPMDVVLLDVTLPDMDGFTVCRNLRAANATMPVIFVTARGAIKDYAIGREVGGDSYLVKPIARSALRSIVSLFAHAERTATTAGTGAPEGNATPIQDGTGVPLAPADLTASAMVAGIPPAIVPTKP